MEIKIWVVRVGYDSNYHLTLHTIYKYQTNLREGVISRLVTCFNESLFINSIHIPSIETTKGYFHFTFTTRGIHDLPAVSISNFTVSKATIHESLKIHGLYSQQINWKIQKFKVLQNFQIPSKIHSYLKSFDTDTA